MDDDFTENATNNEKRENAPVDTDHINPSIDKTVINQQGSDEVVESEPFIEGNIRDCILLLRLYYVW